MDTHQTPQEAPCHDQCFNWATGFYPWIPLGRGPRMKLSQAASIGPRVFTRGYIRSALDVEITGQLQLGHGFLPVDTTALRPLIARDSHSFNWATGFYPWIPCMARSRSLIWSLSFNWATGFYPWIPGNSRPEPSARSPLQLGHGFLPVDTSAWVHPWARHTHRFNWATGFYPWILHPSNSAKRSRSATVFSRGTLLVVKVHIVSGVVL